jgi:DNA replication licensing factor MCM6
VRGTKDSCSLYIDRDPTKTVSCVTFLRCSFEPVLRRAITELVRQVVPEYLQQDAEPKEFFVSFFNLDTQLRVRDLRMDKVGGLVSFNGTVTRTSEVRPELLWGRFVCGECGAISAPVEQQFKYTEPTRCVRSDCSNRVNWRLDISRSRFVDWQRIRVQENADEIPPGSMPRSVDVVLRHAAVEKAKAGDKAFFVGTLIVIPDLAQLYKAGAVSTAVARSQNSGAGGGRNAGEGVTGMRQLGVRDLTYRVAFLAQSVAKGTPYGIGSGGNTSSLSDGFVDENPDADYVNSLSQEEKDKLQEMGASPTIYADLVASLAPMIHGHTEIKKGLLLMLLGGVHKRSMEGVRLRGDINVCIVGDPSTAKSQFLKVSHRESKERGTKASNRTFIVFLFLSPYLTVRYALLASLRLHVGQVRLSSRSNSVNSEGSRHRGIHRGSGCFDACGQRHLLHRRVRQDGFH